MSRIDRWIDTFDRINDVMHDILFTLQIPFLLLFVVFYEIFHSWREKRQRRKEERDPKYQIKKKLEAGELRLCDLPHQHVETSNSFAFYPNPDKTYEAYLFYYLALEPDERISRFLQEEREAIARWSAWYGFEIIIVEDTDKFLSDMCFPQDKRYLRHGLMRNVIATCEREYGQNIRPYTYYELDADSKTPLLDQLYLIVQDVLSKDW